MFSTPKAVELPRDSVVQAEVLDIFRQSIALQDEAP
jgi:hypothetical protein